MKMHILNREFLANLYIHSGNLYKELKRMCNVCGKGILISLSVVHFSKPCSFLTEQF